MDSEQLPWVNPTPSREVVKLVHVLWERRKLCCGLPVQSWIPAGHVQRPPRARKSWQVAAVNSCVRAQKCFCCGYFLMICICVSFVLLPRFMFLLFHYWRIIHVISGLHSGMNERLRLISVTLTCRKPNNTCTKVICSASQFEPFVESFSSRETSVITQKSTVFYITTAKFQSFNDFLKYFLLEQK